MKPIKIAAVSYLNTFPFVYGITQSGLLQDYTLELDIPSVCAEKIRAGEVDISLVPAGALPGLKDYQIIPGFCIGAVSEVKTVLLLSDKPLPEITSIGLDTDSRTSVELVKVLANHHWKINPGYYPLQPGKRQKTRPESMVAIGDKTFLLRKKYPFVYDLATEWIGFTGLPFVFAVWIARKNTPKKALGDFREALAFGVKHKAECIEFFEDRLPGCGDCLSYLEHNISYKLDEEKQEGLEKFLSYLS
jgi:chorismate dehydratase